MIQQNSNRDVPDEHSVTVAREGHTDSALSAGSLNHHESSRRTDGQVCLNRAQTQTLRQQSLQDLRDVFPDNLTSRVTSARETHRVRLAGKTLGCQWT